MAVDFVVNFPLSFLTAENIFAAESRNLEINS